jgi:hypothetical protein
MRLTHYLFAIALFCLTSLSMAANIYRHVPFTVTMTSQDKVIVDYDFSQQTGIACSADSQPLQIHFVYKGRAKIADLPVILESAHVPNQDHEELADINGQFTISSDHELYKRQNYVVICHYLFTN